MGVLLEFLDVLLVDNSLYRYLVSPYLFSFEERVAEFQVFLSHYLGSILIP